MHELSLVKNLVETILGGIEKEPDGKGPVSEVVMRVGALELHSEEAFRQAFEVTSRGTVLEGAALRLTIVKAVLKCGACGHESACGDGEVDAHDPMPFAECPKCGRVSAVTGGRGVNGIEVTFGKREGIVGTRERGREI